MDQGFKTALNSLNSAQKSAVEQIDGPVMVLAGPGTGKTQLLALRVANILKQTDALPSNILCLTFTDNAARNMRERLASIIGQAAYHVSIHTFHSFGNEIINQFPDHFSSRMLMQQVDELGRYQLLKDIFEGLPHSNPLSPKAGDDNYIFLKDSLEVIGWLKQNALSPTELHEIINANQAFIEKVSGLLSEAFDVPTSPKQLPAYEELLKTFEEQAAVSTPLFGFPDYASVATDELRAAIDASPTSGRFAPPMTAWRNAWCQKDAEGRSVFKDAGRNLRKLHALANVYEQLLKRMNELGLYDFDDMIVEVVHALEQDKELLFSLQERYQYILVDEFQDTNKAQLRLLDSLGDNPVNDGRPNIMVVGDDDQAIYAFQGAETSNMVAFSEHYGIDKPIVLTDNYRSSSRIISASEAVSAQITDRLVNILPGLTKQLKPQTKYQSSTVSHLSFSSELAQYDWIAEKIEDCLKQGTKPEAIAVVAPQHRYLERLMPYLGERHLPVAYERRENILEAPIILQLLSMTSLVLAIAANDQALVDYLFGEVITYDFWGLPTETLVDISLNCYDNHSHWLKVLSSYKDKRVVEIADWFIDLAKGAHLEPLEYLLDRLLGGISGGDSESDEVSEVTKGKKAKPAFTSPMREYYFNNESYEQATDDYLTLLGQLTSLRHRLRLWKPDKTLFAADLIEFADLHKSAGLKIIDTNPHTRTTDAVQVMTAYKAKGLEFEVVFVINAQDEVWGPTARSRVSKISLPKNLPIEPASSSDNDRLRLLYVALTRAKQELYLTSYTNDLDNRPSPGLSFINEAASVFGPQAVDKPASVHSVAILTTSWAYRFKQVIADKPALLEPILADYKLSVTHLNNFLDVVNSGPDYFLRHNLLRFPASPTASASYGDAVHKTLQRAHIELLKAGKLPDIESVTAYFVELLGRKHLRQTDYNRLEKRGSEALKLYFKERSARFSNQDLIERGFSNEGVVIDGAALSGKIDKLELTQPGMVKVIDFKTGKPSLGWAGKDEFEKLKLHKYRQQLLFYKLLVENSASFKNKLQVTGGELEFVEAGDNGHLVDNLELTYDSQEIERFTALVSAVWQHITTLNFPDVSGYQPTLKGVGLFEQDLIDGRV